MIATFITLTFALIKAAQTDVPPDQSWFHPSGTMLFGQVAARFPAYQATVKIKVSSILAGSVATAH
jgi:hypothetical protein